MIKYRFSKGMGTSNNYPNDNGGKKHWKGFYRIYVE